jgi:chemotaxis methyl-accepting protein methylase
VPGAERTLAEGVAAHPSASPLLVNAAALAAELGRPDAPALAARAASADPTSPHAHRLVGDAYYRAGRHAEAALAYRAAVRLDPALGPEVWARLGALALRDGARPAAVEAWERACKLQPDHPTARANLDAVRRQTRPDGGPRSGATARPARRRTPAVRRDLLPRPARARGPAAPGPAARRRPGGLRGAARAGRARARLPHRQLQGAVPAPARRRADAGHRHAHVRAVRARARRRPGEYERLLDALTINVTRLFRDRDAWAALDASVVAPLVDAGGPLRAWSAGCASGEEPYSVAALVHARLAAAGRLDALERVRVLGTDVDPRALAAARGGALPAAAFAETAPELRDRYFPPHQRRAVPGGTVADVAPELRGMVDFARHDLLREPPPEGPWDLVTCRNVVIYFDRASQDALFERFHGALAPGGVLFLGKVETLLGRIRALFAPVDARYRIFRRI